MNPPRFFSFLGKPDNSEKAGTESGENEIQCELCPRRCIIASGNAGRCKVRVNSGGKAEIPFYGFITALAVDPIEKKPLYHFRPGSDILSVGFAGCNLHCPFCQNWHISQINSSKITDNRGTIYTSSDLINEVIAYGSEAAAHDTAAMQSIAAMRSIAYTYSEPLVHIEFLLDCMQEAHRSGIANVLVSNGCINSEAADEVLSLTDAANIDLKCFSKETYKNILGGDLSTVLGFIRKAVDRGIHVELTTLVVPGLNDSIAELDKCRDFISELETKGKTIPWHLSAYHPAHKWDAPATNPHILIATAARAREKLEFVYSGNIALRNDEQNFNDTFCLHCRKILIKRRGYKVTAPGLILEEKNENGSYFCGHCGKETPVRWI